MNEIITDEILSRHGISGLTPEKSRTILAAIVIAVRNRLTAKLIGRVSALELAELEAASGGSLENKLSNLAETYNMKDWVKSEAEAVTAEIVSKSRKN
jgi:hypothetical protein